MSDQDPDPTSLEHRTALPDALRVLLEEYPRERWQAHRNFDGLTRFWLERHLMFRRLLAQMQDENRVFLEGGLEARLHGGRMQQMAGFLIDQLHGHHQIEDHHYFPVLCAAEPRLERGFAILDSDHQALDRHLHALAGAANRLLGAIAAGQGAREAAGALEARLEPFRGFIDRHLSDEEDLVVPVILHHGSRF